MCTKNTPKIEKLYFEYILLRYYVCWLFKIFRHSGLRHFLNSWTTHRKCFLTLLQDFIAILEIIDIGIIGNNLKAICNSFVEL